MQDRDRLVLPLVKYECGCVGFAPDAQGRIIMVSDDSAREQDFSLWNATTGHEGKRFEPLPDDRAAYYARHMAELMEDGFKLDTIRHALAPRVQRVV